MSPIYVIESRPGGWVVTQDGAVVSRHAMREDAEQSGALMALATKAAGGRVGLFVKGTAGVLSLLDAGHVMTARCDPPNAPSDR